MNTKMVYEGQLKRKELIEQKTYDNFYHDVLKVVIDMEHNGAKFNDEAKASVTQDIEEKLFTAMENLIDLAGKYTDKATFNPDSPQQLFKIIFGLNLKPDHAEEWKSFSKRFKPWEKGSQSKLDYTVERCFEKLPDSLQVKPDVDWLTDRKFITETGFSVSSKVIDSMLGSSCLTKTQEKFVAAVQAYSKASTWKSSNLNGVFDGIRDDGFVHGQINMHITSTRRFSASAPNTQNWPREGTNPIKKLIKSRYEGGHIVAADYGQLEFRIAGLLSDDKLLIQDVANDMDIHSHTATVAFGDKFTNSDGKERKEMRQKAKTKTFAFQYGATPKTKIDQAIFDAFYGKYTKLANWQERTIAYIGRHQRYICPFTGVVFAFPDASPHTEYAFGTKAKNYPIQFLSDAINKCALLGIYERVKGRDDIKLILTVHDSDVLDAAPHAIDEAKQILKEEMEGVSKTFEKYFNKGLDIPLAVDVSSGETWFDQQ
jgi:DNA polymerase I-like protein with 3'-5' exonuclease and polymerase domains